MTVTIREIKESDYVPVLSLWNNELGNPWADSENMKVTYEQMKEDPNYATFVADVDGTAVGMVTTVRVMAVGFPQGYLKVNGLAVMKEYRGEGIGSKLMQYVEDRAKVAGITSIGLASGFQRTGAHAFYESLGYEKGSYWFGKSLN